MKIAADELREQGCLWYTSNRQKRHNFLTSYVKLARMEPEKFHGRAGETGMRLSGRIPFAVSSKAFSGPHSESRQRMRPFFLHRETE